MFKNVNWTTIIFATIVAVGMWFVPSPLHKCPVNNINIPQVGVGHVVSTDIPLPAQQATVKIKHKPKPIKELVVPDFVEAEIIDTANGINIRTTTYLEIVTDTLQSYTEIEYNIKPKPLHVDTVYKYITITMDSVVYEPRPFYEHPVFVASATTLTIYGILRIFTALKK